MISLLGSIGLTVTNFDQAPFQLNSLSISNVFGDAAEV